MKLAILAAAALLCAGGAAAQTCGDLVDFQSLEIADPNLHVAGLSHDEDGYRVSVGPGERTPFRFFGTAHPDFPGSTALFHPEAGGRVVLSRLDGALFTVTSIDLATISPEGPVAVEFEGVLPGGSLVRQTFDVRPVGGVNALRRFAFNGLFSGLRRLEWRQDGAGHQFDRLALAVPETLDFEALRQNNAQVNTVGRTYQEDGYVFTKGPGEPYPFAVFGTLEPRFAGSTALFNDSPEGVITLRRADGRPFDIAWVRLATLNRRGPAAVAFTGTLFDGSSVFQEFEVNTLGGLNTLQGFLFKEEFRSITALEWTQEWPFHQFDGLVVSCAANACYADCDPSSGPGVLDVFDFLCFQNAFAALEPYACECDATTGVGVCDIFDFLCYQNAFAAGCP